jgi:hypothetical protein
MWARPFVPSAPLPGRRRDQRWRACDLLGASHPLVRVTDDIRLMAEQSIAVTAMLAAGLSAVLAGGSEAGAVVVAALLVQVAVTWRLVLRASARRDLVLDLIAEGRGHLPLRSVARECRRLGLPGSAFDSRVHWMPFARRRRRRPCCAPHVSRSTADASSPPSRRSSKQPPRRSGEMMRACAASR